MDAYLSLLSNCFSEIVVSATLTDSFKRVSDSVGNILIGDVQLVINVVGVELYHAETVTTLHFDVLSADVTTSRVLSDVWFTHDWLSSLSFFVREGAVSAGDRSPHRRFARPDSRD
jgi:hypothetical protein